MRQPHVSIQTACRALLNGLRPLGHRHVLASIFGPHMRTLRIETCLCRKRQTESGDAWMCPPRDTEICTPPIHRDPRLMVTLSSVYSLQRTDQKGRTAYRARIQRASEWCRPKPNQGPFHVATHARHHPRPSVRCRSAAIGGGEARMLEYHPNKECWSVHWNA